MNITPVMSFQNLPHGHKRTGRFALPATFGDRYVSQHQPVNSIQALRFGADEAYGWDQFVGDVDAILDGFSSALHLDDEMIQEVEPNFQRMLDYLDSHDFEPNLASILPGNVGIIGNRPTDKKLQSTITGKIDGHSVEVSIDAVFIKGSDDQYNIRILFPEQARQLGLDQFGSSKFIHVSDIKDDPALIRSVSVFDSDTLSSKIAQLTQKFVAHFQDDIDRMQATNS